MVSPFNGNNNYSNTSYYPGNFNNQPSKKRQESDPLSSSTSTSDMLTINTATLFLNYPAEIKGQDALILDKKNNRSFFNYILQNANYPFTDEHFKALERMGDIIFAEAAYYSLIDSEGNSILHSLFHLPLATLIEFNERTRGKKLFLLEPMYFSDYLQRRNINGAFPVELFIKKFLTLKTKDLDKLKILKAFPLVRFLFETEVKVKINLLTHQELIQQDSRNKEIIREAELKGGILFDEGKDIFNDFLSYSVIITALTKGAQVEGLEPSSYTSPLINSFSPTLSLQVLNLNKSSFASKLNQFILTHGKGDVNKVLWGEFIKQEGIEKCLIEVNDIVQYKNIAPLFIQELQNAFINELGGKNAKNFVDLITSKFKFFPQNFMGFLALRNQIGHDFLMRFFTYKPTPTYKMHTYFIEILKQMGKENIFDDSHACDKNNNNILHLLFENVPLLIFIPCYLPYLQSIDLSHCWRKVNKEGSYPYDIFLNKIVLLIKDITDSCTDNTFSISKWNNFSANERFESSLLNARLFINGFNLEGANPSRQVFISSSMQLEIKNLIEREKLNPLWLKVQHKIKQEVANLFKACLNFIFPVKEKYGGEPNANEENQTLENLSSNKKQDIISLIDLIKNIEDKSVISKQDEEFIETLLNFKSLTNSTAVLQGLQKSLYHKIINQPDFHASLEFLTKEKPKQFLNFLITPNQENKNFLIYMFENFHSFLSYATMGNVCQGVMQEVMQKAFRYLGALEEDKVLVDNKGNNFLHLLCQNVPLSIFMSTYIFFLPADFSPWFQPNYQEEYPCDLLLKRMLYAKLLTEKFGPSYSEIEVFAPILKYLVLLSQQKKNNASFISLKMQTQITNFLNVNKFFYIHPDLSLYTKSYYEIFNSFLSSCSTFLKDNLTHEKDCVIHSIPASNVWYKKNENSLAQDLSLLETTTEWINTPQCLQTYLENCKQHPVQFSELQKFYQMLVQSIDGLWNQEQIQDNLGRLLQDNLGQRTLDLTLAQVKKKLDTLGISYILKPFYDLYLAHPILTKTQKLGIQAVIQDAIQTLHLSLGDTALTELEVNLNKNFPKAAFFTSFLLKELQSQTEQEVFLQETLERHEVQFLSYEEKEGKEYLFTIRTILFAYGLKELKARALNLDKLPQEGELEICQKPAILIYTKHDQSYSYALKVVQNAKTSSLLAIVEDNEQETFGFQPISVKDLTKLTEEHRKDPKAFFLFSPLSLPKTKAPLPDLKTLEIQKPTFPKKRKIREEKEIQDATASLSSKDKKQEREGPKNKKPFQSYFPSSNQPTQNMASLSIVSPSIQKGVLSGKKHFFDDPMPLLPATSSSETEEKGPKKSKKADAFSSPVIMVSQVPGVYQPINLAPIIKTPMQVSAGEKVLVSFAGNVSLQKEKQTFAFDRNLLDDLLDSFCQSTLKHMQTLIDFESLTNVENLLKSTESLTEILKTLLINNNVLSLIFGDKKLKNYQRQAVLRLLEAFEKNLSFVLSLAPGLGKTKVSIEVFHQLQKKDPRGRPYLVIVPNSLLPQWRDNLLTEGFNLRLRYYKNLLKQLPLLTAEQQQKLKRTLQDFLSINQQYLKTCQQDLQTKEQELATASTNVMRLTTAKVDSMGQNTQKSEQVKNGQKYVLKLTQQVEELKHKEKEYNRRLEKSKKLFEAAQVSLSSFNNQDSLLTLFTYEVKEANEEIFKNLLRDALAEVKIESKQVESYLDDLLKNKDFMNAKNAYKKDKNLFNLVFFLWKMKASFPMQKEQIKAFLQMLKKEKSFQPAQKETLTLDSCLLNADFYSQVVCCMAGQKIIPNYDSSNPDWKIVLMPISTLESLDSKEMEQLQNQPWNCVVLDEAHYYVEGRGLKDKRKKSTQLIEDLAFSLASRYKTHLLPLTGTPFVNSLQDSLFLLQLANPLFRTSLKDLSKFHNNLEAKYSLSLAQGLKQLQKELPYEKKEIEINLANWLLSSEHVRTLLQQLIIYHTMQEKSIKEDWTTKEGKLMLPQSEEKIQKFPLTPEQEQQLYSGNFGKRNMLQEDKKLECLLFHPCILEANIKFSKMPKKTVEEKKIKKKEQKEYVKSLKKQIKAMDETELETFIKQSAFLTFFFMNPMIAESLKNKKKFIIFLPQIKFCKIFKCLFKRYFKEHEMKLYNGEEAAEVRAHVINAFESKDNNLSALAITPKAGGAGLNLPSTDEVIHGGLEWTWTSIQQMNGRALRVNKNTLTKIVHFDHGTAREYHKIETVKCKERWQNALFSKKSTQETFNSLLEAFIQSYWVPTLQSLDRKKNEEKKGELTQQAQHVLLPLLNKLLEQTSLPMSDFAKKLKKVRMQ